MIVKYIIIIVIFFLVFLLINDYSCENYSGLDIQEHFAIKNCGIQKEKDECKETDGCNWFDYRQKCVQACSNFVSESRCRADMCNWKKGKCITKTQEDLKENNYE
jgi:hypothetical protein